jgi:hypothetical protein
MKALPSGVKVTFCTCFPIAARAIRGSEFSNLRKSRCRTSTNLRVSRMNDLTASGTEHTIFHATVSSSRSNSPSLAMRNLDGCPSAIASVQFAICCSMVALHLSRSLTPDLREFAAFASASSNPVAYIPSRRDGAPSLAAPLGAAPQGNAWAPGDCFRKPAAHGKHASSNRSANLHAS